MSLEMTGEYRIAAPQQRVWEALNDPAVLKDCIAGCRALERVAENEFSAIVATQLGPVTVTFRGTVVLSQLHPPHSYTLTGQGQGGAAGFARMSADVTLAPDGDGTLLRYAAQATIGGKLASIGSRLVQTVAKKNADDFFSAFERRLAGHMQPTATTDINPSTSPDMITSAFAAAPVQGHAPGLLAAAVPAWLVPFCTALGVALGYCLGLLAR